MIEDVSDADEAARNNILVHERLTTVICAMKLYNLYTR